MPQAKVALLLLLLAVHTSLPALALTRPQEKIILLKLKALCPAISIGTTSTGKVVNKWGSPNFCKWSRVSCDASGHVTRIAFDFDSAFKGTQLPATVKPDYRKCGIPVELAQLDQLQILIIRNARKKGAVVLGPLPGAPWGAPGVHSNPSAFFNLQTLDLSNNGIVSPIPDGWGQKTPAAMPNLRQLFLSRNKLTGRLPKWGSATEVLPNLEWFDVSRNPDLKGPIPPGFLKVGQFAQFLSPVTNRQPRLVVKPQTGIGGCVPDGLPLPNVVMQVGALFVSTGQLTCLPPSPPGPGGTPSG